MTHLHHVLVRAAVGLGVAAAPLPACAQERVDTPSLQAGERPLLSATIKRVLDQRGIEAARQRFREILKGERQRYRLDFEAMTEVGAEYMKQGDVARGQAAMEMALELYEETVAPELAAGIAASAGSAPRPPPTPPPPPPPPVNFGPPRTDLARFLGIYGDPAVQGTVDERNWFSRIGCSPGHLDIGAMWGDVAPWTLKSVGDAEFVEGYVDPQTGRGPFRVSFEIGPDRRAVAMSQNVLNPDGPMTRLPPLGDLQPDSAPLFCERGR